MKREMPAVLIGHIDVFPLFWDISHENDNGDFHPYGPATSHSLLFKEGTSLMLQVHFLENGLLSNRFRLEVVCSMGKFSSLLLHRFVSFFFL